jgi:hypothetical protein
MRTFDVCTDTDYRDNVLDRMVDPERYKEIWSAYRSPDGVSAEKAAEYASELARCKRIVDGWDMIQDDIRSNTVMYLEKCGRKERNLVFSPARQKEMQKLLKQKNLEIKAELEARDGHTAQK